MARLLWVALALGVQFAAPCLAQNAAPSSPSATNHVLDLDGENSWVELPPNLFTNQVVTVEGWVKWRAFGSYSRFFEFASAAQHLTVLNSSSNNTLRVERYDRSPFDDLRVTEVPERSSPRGSLLADVLMGFMPGSLACNFLTNLDARTNASLSTNAEFRFTTYDSAKTNFALNKNFWLVAIPQVTATVVWQYGNPGGNYNSIGGAAISPLHVLNCKHSPWGPGNTLVFVDDNGSNVVRTVIANEYVTNTDINVCLLNSNLPATIHPFSILSAAVTNYVKGGFASTLWNFYPNLFVVAQNQFQRFFPTCLQNVEGTTNGTWVSVFMPGSKIHTNFFPTNWEWIPISGDSGHPVMALMGTNLVLVSHWTTPESGPYYPAYLSNIDAVMHDLSTKNGVGSDYQLTTGGVSGFTVYQ